MGELYVFSSLTLFSKNKITQYGNLNSWLFVLKRDYGKVNNIVAYWLKTIRAYYIAGKLRHVGRIQVVTIVT